MEARAHHGSHGRRPVVRGGRWSTGLRSGHRMPMCRALSASCLHPAWTCNQESRRCQGRAAGGSAYGSVGVGAFEKDDALDWLGEVAESDVLECLDGAFQAVLESSGHRDAPECAAVIAAAELLAAAMGRPCDRIPDEAVSLAKGLRKPSSELIKRARDASSRVLRESELRELWQESDSFAAWEVRMRDLKRRLS